MANPWGKRLPRSFYQRPTIEVARDLLGKVLVHGEAAGIIVETEAYLGGDDLAAHSARGITDRTRVIFGRPGHAYVYFIYGMYECLNLVAEPEGQAGCVLIRALEPVAGIDLMRQRRPAARKCEDLASGPGKLTLAMGITRAQNGSPTVITRNGEPVAAVIPIEDFNVLEDAIDRYFSREADRDLAENPDSPTYSMSEVVAAIFEEDAGRGGA